jgi:hypothetical protein
VNEARLVLVSADYSSEVFESTVFYVKGGRSLAYTEYEEIASFW